MTLRKETAGLGSEGPETAVGAGMVGMAGVSSQTDKEPKAGGKHFWR